MPRVHITGHVRGYDAADALVLITDYERWPGASEAVQAVRVARRDDGTFVSHWEVTFRRGLMEWSELDELDHEALISTFDLIEGDPDTFVGSWRAEPTPNGCRLAMDAEFDLGMPSLDHILDPIAIEAIEDAVESVLQTLFGEDVRVEFGESRSRAEGAA